MDDFHEIDGARGEGGGQVLRNALSLALYCREPVRIEHIRDNRSKPGLRYQHLTAAEAVAVVGDGEPSGAEVGFRTLEFRPGELQPGSYRFDVGTAGSAVLVLQTLLPAMACLDSDSEIVVEGGTHAKSAPLFEFLDDAYVPMLNRMGANIDVCMLQPGFYPRGGGRVSANIRAGCNRLQPIELLERGEVRRISATAIIAHLPDDIAHRECMTLEEKLGSLPVDLATRKLEMPEAESPGNALSVVVESDALTEVFSQAGEKGVPAETIAGRCADRVLAYLDSDAPVGPHLGDQLLLPFAIAGGGEMRVTRETDHLRTQAELIPEFLPVDFDLQPDDGGVHITCESDGQS
jgi:RNA 3'-terminal phosphate cyclase (ATP)